MRAALLAMVVACVPPAADPQPSYFAQPQYQQQPQYAQPQPQYAPQPQQYAPPQPQYAPTQPPAPAPVATALTCGQALTECFRGGDSARCLQDRATPRAQWLLGAIAKCGQSQNCRVGWCVEQGCPDALAHCRADTASASDSAAPVPFEGEWSYGTTSLVGFYSPTTGFTPGSGSGGSWKFEHGTFEAAAMLTSRMYACEMKVFSWSTGHYKLEGNTLTVVTEQEKVKNDDTCSHKSSTSEGKHETRVFTVAIEPDMFGINPELVLYQNGQRYQSYSHK